ncbi:MAG: GMC oxidoreductase [bacterium]
MQQLYEGDLIGRPYFPLDACRIRGFGGSSGCWARPLPPAGSRGLRGPALRPRERVAHHPGRPDPWYAEAERFLGLKGPGWDSPRWHAPQAAPWKFADPRVASTFFKLSAPIRLAQTMPGPMRAAANVRVIVGASLTRIGLAPGGRQVQALHARRTLGDAGFTVVARRYVLACGGIENARLLLASDDVQRGGVGNGHDLVGRYFMEHPHTDGEGLLLGSPALPPASFYQRHTRLGQPIWGSLGLTAEARAQEGLLAATVVLLPRRDQPRALEEPLRLAMADTDAPGQPLPKAGVAFTFGTPSEQIPDRDSRVLLGGERDRLGLPRVRLDWRVSPVDARSVARTHEILAEALARSGFGRIRLTLPTAGPFPAHTGGGRHHMGTTRMHADPARGVVDADCRVHGVADLYIAGSSVFTTSGSANPTLSIVALARRLAAHLDVALP